MDTRKALLGMVAGFAAGAILGLLMAPEKGSRTRRMIVRKGEDLVDELNDRIDQKFDEVVDILSRRGKKAKERNGEQHANVEE